ncbi:MAG: GNAT family N-acetyltransferase [Bacilli bacterium]|nr:GNAT family N-acetyltransferase [Bacilli bacterium]
MIKRITADSKIFSSREFERDRNLFNIYIDNIYNEDAEIYSDEENYILFRGNTMYPIWIWTRNGIDESITSEIAEAMNLYLDDVEQQNFVCKKELYNHLQSSSLLDHPEGSFEMKCLSCKNLIEPKPSGGYYQIASTLDVKVLYQYYLDYLKEINHIDYVQISEDDLEQMIYDKGIYVWKDSNENIVSMATYFEKNLQYRLRMIYTKTLKRGQGYATNLIYKLTTDMIKGGLEPVVYINNNYPPTEHIFQKVGYEDNGILIYFSGSRQKIKKGIV